MTVRHLAVLLRDLAAMAVFSVVAWAPQIAAALVGSGLIVLLTHEGMSVVSGLPVLGIGLFGSVIVGLACTLPVLSRTDDTTTSRHHDVTTSRRH